MPTYRLKGNLIHFAAYGQHIGLYPAPSAVKAFAERLHQYSPSKGAVRFPLDRPIPYDLVAEMIRFRVRENLAEGR